MAALPLRAIYVLVSHSQSEVKLEPLDPAQKFKVLLYRTAGMPFLEGLGLRSARSLVVEGLFDYPQQSLLYVPQHLPDPRSPGFTAELRMAVLEGPVAQEHEPPIRHLVREHPADRPFQGLDHLDSWTVFIPRAIAQVDDDVVALP